MLIAAALLTGQAGGADNGVSAPASMEPFFENYCYNCHDADTAKADLNLEDLTRRIASSTDALHWQDILDQLNASEYYERNRHIHAKGRMLSHDLLVEHVSVFFRTDARAHYRVRFCGGVVDGIAVRRGVRLMEHNGRLEGKHGSAVGSFLRSTICKCAGSGDGSS